MAHDHCAAPGLLPLDAALARYIDEVRPLPVVELPLEQALHRVLAAPVSAAVDLPMFTQSAVDGYALRAVDLAPASAAAPVRLPLVGEVRAGVASDARLAPGTTMRIFTGGRLPNGADTVARQEIVERVGDLAVLREALPLATDVRARGEELRAGSSLAEPGQRIDAGLIAALAMAGIARVSVRAAPRVSLLVTGDEVSSAPTDAAGVYDANGPLIRTWFVERGYAAPLTRYVVDDADVLRDALRAALDDSDLVLTTGGVSVGDHDLVRPVSQDLGVREIFWQVAQKPGKPLYFGVRDDGDRRRLLLGLPGNPGAVFIGLHVHVATVLGLLEAGVAPRWQAGRLQSAVSADAREQLLRMMLSIDEQGRSVLRKLDRQASHMLSNLSRANALVRIPAGESRAAGSVVSWLPLR